ncbi:MAG: hypothetical protein FWC27_00115 [Firmicutes bacterium]|nr:hypothetical protein [Bacillota bacterium]
MEDKIPDCIQSGVACDGECCDECDYLICCAKDGDELCGRLCGKCLAENGACPFNIIPPPGTPSPPPRAGQ